MRIVGYLRVSTDKQAERGHGLDIQERAIRAWCKREGHKLAALYRDEGISGTKLAERVGLADALAQLSGKQAAGIVVYRLDRLARDLVVQEQILADVRRYGAQAFSTSDSEAGFLVDTPDDPSRKLIRQILGSVAEYERSMVSLRLAAGRRRKADKGGFAYGSPSYGQQAQGGELVDDTAEQAALARIRELHAQGESLRSIGATLTAEGHKPKRSKTGTWHPQSLSRIVARL